MVRLAGAFLAPPSFACLMPAPRGLEDRLVAPLRLARLALGIDFLMLLRLPAGAVMLYLLQWQGQEFETGSKPAHNKPALESPCRASSQRAVEQHTSEPSLPIATTSTKSTGPLSSARVVY